MEKHKERRNYPRISGRFIVSYRVYEEADNVDISQTKNISLGGMLLTTNRLFKPNTILAVTIRLPSDRIPVHIKALVVDSKEIVKNTIYDTRLKFLEIDERHKKVISQSVNYYLKRNSNK
jgi:c-di-GMP-binding flagellar brake protein YcgR